MSDTEDERPADIDEAIDDKGLIPPGEDDDDTDPAPPSLRP